MCPFLKNLYLEVLEAKELVPARSCPVCPALALGRGRQREKGELGKDLYRPGGDRVLFINWVILGFPGEAVERFRYLKGQGSITQNCG